MRFVLLISFLSAANAMNFWEFLDKYNNLDLSAVTRALGNIDQISIQSPTEPGINEIMSAAAGRWDKVAKTFATATEPLLKAVDDTSTPSMSTIGTVQGALISDLDGPLREVFKSHNQLIKLVYKAFIDQVGNICSPNHQEIWQAVHANIDADFRAFHQLLTDAETCANSMIGDVTSLGKPEFTSISSIISMLQNLIKVFGTPPKSGTPIQEFWEESVLD